MKKQLLIFLVTLLTGFGASAQWTPIAFSEVTGIQTITPWYLKFNTEHTAINLSQNDLIAVSIGRAILPSGDTITSSDSLILQSGLQIPHVMQIDVLTENTTVEFFVETKIVDTVGGAYNVVDVHFSVPMTATTAFLNGVPASWGHSFVDITSGGATLHVDSLDGQNGTTFSIVQQSGPGTLVSQSVYVVGMQYDVEIPISNAQPLTTYGVRLRGDAGGGIVLFTSQNLQFTTAAVTGPLVYLDSLDATSTYQEIEFTVIGNGSPTSFVIYFNGSPIYAGTVTDTITGSVPANGLVFSTGYTWSITAQNGGGSTTASLDMMTAALDDLSLGEVSHDSTGFYQVELTIPTQSDGGSATVTVSHGGNNFSGGTVTAGYDTAIVTITGLTPGQTEEVTIHLTRQVDGATASWTYYVVMWDPGQVSATIVQPNPPTSNSHTIVLNAERSVGVGGLSADLTLEIQTQVQPPVWSTVNTQSLYSSNGVIQDTISYTNLVNSSNYRFTALVGDSASPYTDRTVIATFSTGPVPNQPNTSFTTPMTWSTITWIAQVQLNANPMSLNGGTLYLRASDTPSALGSQLSNVDQQSLSAGWTQGVMLYVDLNPYIIAEVDTLYYLALIENTEGGSYMTQTFALAVPSGPEPEPEGPLVWLGGQANDVDTSEALVQIGLMLNNLDSVEIEIEWWAFGGFSGSVGPVSVANMNTNVYMSGLPPGKTINCDVRAYIAGVDQGIIGSFSFDTDEVPVVIDPSGIEDLLMQTPNVRGDLVDLLGRTIASNVPLIEMERGWYQFNADVVTWTDRKGHSKRYVNNVR